MKKRIMFVDDDESFLVLVKRACSKIPEISEVMTALDGQEAKDLIANLLDTGGHLPNLIFVDINMPRMDGFEFLHAFSLLRQQHQQLASVRPIAMLTSSDEQRDREKAKKLGADDYIVKPAGLVDMRNLLSGLVK